MFFQVANLFSCLVAGVVSAEYQLVQFAHDHVAPAALAHFLRSACKHDAGHIGADSANEHSRDNAVAGGEQHQSVQQLYAGHYFHRGGNDVSNDQFIAEVGHTNGNRSAGGDGAKLKRRAASLQYACPYARGEPIEVDMPKPRIVCSVDNAYQRLSEVSVVIAAALVYRTA